MKLSLSLVNNNMDPMMIIAVAVLLVALYLTWRLWFPLVLFVSVILFGLALGSLFLVMIGIAAVADFITLRWRKFKRMFKK